MKSLQLLIIIGILASSCQQQKKEVNTNDPNAEVKKVALVLEKYVIANEKQDLDLVHEIWAPLPDIVVFGTNSDEVLVGWGSIRDALKRQFGTFEDTFISVRDQRIKVNESCNTAWFSEVMNYNYIYKGQAKQFEGLRFTGVMEKIDGEWYIVQSHVSIPGAPD